MSGGRLLLVGVLGLLVCAGIFILRESSGGWLEIREEAAAPTTDPAEEILKAFFSVDFAQKKIVDLNYDLENFEPVPQPRPALAAVAAPALLSVGLRFVAESDMGGAAVGSIASLMTGAMVVGSLGALLGTFAGVTVYGLILTICNREGLEIWWNRILIGVILLGFVLLQRVLVAKRR